eukprot:5994918-Amphidinium_carterae.1
MEGRAHAHASAGGDDGGSVRMGEGGARSADVTAKASQASTLSRSTTRQATHTHTHTHTVVASSHFTI